MLSSDIIRGHLDAIVLRLVEEKDRYGYEISKEIESRTTGRFQIKEATLYAVFQRLEKKELLKSYTGSVTFGSKRRYYTITELGRVYLKEETQQWREAKELIDIFMEDSK
ncbi:MAG TPA: PadR family transcriptional regulator [Clostridia bacterium]|nr:PadR family transcriptional regulator [Clostridia bacterium]